MKDVIAQFALVVEGVKERQASKDAISHLYAMVRKSVRMSIRQLLMSFQETPQFALFGPW